ncbi:MAG: hypothetical protein MJZ16_07635, partial [Bacteroidales bacterium]|nr:hypothetical protein [Bacteroidales bacterium]
MKSVKMILGVAAAALLVSFSANAQENGNRDDNNKIVRGAYETNAGKDNWFIGIGAGVNSFVFVENAKPGLGLAGDVFVGKWFTPSVGARLGWHGLTNSLKEVEKGYTLGADGKYWMNSVNADFLWNFSNAVSGYKETRTWDLIPYARFGVYDFNGRDKAMTADLEYGAGLGLINDFRLGNHVDLFLDLSMVCIASRVSGIKPRDDKRGFIPSASLGLMFNLGKTGFDRHSSVTPVVVPVPFTVDQYNALKNKVDALEKENAALKNRIAELESMKPDTVYVDAPVTASATLYFDCGKTTLSQRELAHLEYYASSLS